MIDERVAGNARLLVVGLGETAVDDHQLAVGLYRVLAASGMHGHVAVDDVAVGMAHLEGVENPVHHFFVVSHLEIVALILLVGLGVFKEITLEGGHLGLVEECGVGTAPQIHEIVAREITHCLGTVVLERRTHEETRMVHQLPAAVFLAAEQLHFLQGAVVVERHRSMEEQVVVGDVVHTAVAEQQLYVVAQLLAHGERMVELLHEFLLFLRQHVGMLGVYRGEKAALHGIFLAVDDAHALVVVNIVEEHAVFHLPFGVLLYQGGFHLELDYGDGFVHHGDEANGLLIENACAA